jgi:hypothetical protein
MRMLHVRVCASAEENVREFQAVQARELNTSSQFGLSKNASGKCDGKGRLIFRIHITELEVPNSLGIALYNTKCSIHSNI